MLFRSRRGLAMGIAMTGAGIAGFWVPRFVAYLIELQGWRVAMSGLGFLACPVAPLVWFGFRGERRTGREATRSIEHGMDLAQALRTSRFWILSIMAIAMSLGVGGLVVHFVPLFSDLGAEPGRVRESPRCWALRPSPGGSASACCSIAFQQIWSRWRPCCWPPRGRYYSIRMGCSSLQPPSCCWGLRQARRWTSLPISARAISARDRMVRSMDCSTAYLFSDTD